MDHLLFILVLAFVAAFVVFIVRRRAKLEGGTASVGRVGAVLRDWFNAARKAIQER